MTTALHPENRYQDRYLKEKIATYKRYADMVKREMEIKQSQVKKRYYKVFVERSARNQHDDRKAEQAGTDDAAAAATSASPAPPSRRRGISRPPQATFSSSKPRLSSSFALAGGAAAAADPLRNKVSSLSLYTITAHSLERSRLRAVRKSPSRSGNGVYDDDADNDDRSDGGTSITAADFSSLIGCIRRRLAKESSQQRRLAVRNTSLRRTTSAQLEQNPLFAEEQCWRKGADGVIRRVTVHQQQAPHPRQSATADYPAAAARTRHHAERPPPPQTGTTFLTELPRLPTAMPPQPPPERQPLQLTFSRRRDGGRREPVLASEPDRPLAACVA